jgi:hypothetical protein
LVDRCHPPRLAPERTTLPADTRRAVSPQPAAPSQKQLASARRLLCLHALSSFQRTEPRRPPSRQPSLDRSHSSGYRSVPLIGRFRPFWGNLLRLLTTSPECQALSAMRTSRDGQDWQPLMGGRSPFLTAAVPGLFLLQPFPAPRRAWRSSGEPFNRTSASSLCQPIVVVGLSARRQCHASSPGVVQQPSSTVSDDLDVSSAASVQRR